MQYVIKMPQGKIFEVKCPKDFMCNFSQLFPLKSSLSHLKIRVNHFVLHCYPTFLEVSPICKQKSYPLSVSFQDVLPRGEGKNYRSFNHFCFLHSRSAVLEGPALECSGTLFGMLFVFGDASKFCDSSAEF